MSSNGNDRSKKPVLRPANNCFMSGPCAKRPGYSLTALDTSLLGRSRRAEATETRRAGRHLGAAGEHHVDVAAFDEPRRVTDVVGAG